MDPSQQELTQVVLQYAREGRYGELIAFLAFLYLPFLPAFFKEWKSKREVKKLYEDRLGDKDREIERLAERVKELENLTLKFKRK